MFGLFLVLYTLSGVQKVGEYGCILETASQQHPTTMIEELQGSGCTYSSSCGYGYGPNLSYQVAYHNLGGVRIHVTDPLNRQFILRGNGDWGLGTGQWEQLEAQKTT